jgi:hypothetical protein
MFQYQEPFWEQAALDAVDGVFAVYCHSIAPCSSAYMCRPITTLYTLISYEPCVTQPQNPSPIPGTLTPATRACRSLFSAAADASVGSRQAVSHTLCGALYILHRKIFQCGVSRVPPIVSLATCLEPTPAAPARFSVRSSSRSAFLLLH